ncbi:MAG: hypothetical protein JGK01_15490 [Microcoleus sp. PH2017_03_ELD_O_A]|nr:hypothetical protein [Microcoleus sp. PH2017_03_ELD_O_A]
MRIFWNCSFTRKNWFKSSPFWKKLKLDDSLPVNCQLSTVNCQLSTE